MLPRAFKYDYLGLDVAAIKRSILNRLVYSVGKDNYTATYRDWFHSLAYATRDRLIERWMETMRSHYREDVKRVYYLSMEFLLGRLLLNALINMDIDEEAREALEQIGLDLERLREMEDDAALGNGGLGRLAACFLDSMATLRLPGYGYGIRYEYGMFNQRIRDGWQVEAPENWLRYGNPWEFPRPEVLYCIRFGGRVNTYHDTDGRERHEWVDADEVMAMAYDIPIPGYGTNTVNNLRLWSAKAAREFDLHYFNEGDYVRAIEARARSENISRVLYPSDVTEKGRELRLRQEYFFVSASVQDILRRFRDQHDDWALLPEKVAIQLNDTHPALAIPELMRLLLDEHGLEWDQAWSLTTRVFAYTNHTLLPEALETWPVEMLERLLPRHLQIIYQINHHFLEAVRHRWPGDVDLLRRLSLIDETAPRRVRMAHLAIVGSHKVNGVSQLHADLMRREVFADFDRFYPGRFLAITNGVTPRRWIELCNPALTRLVTRHIGHGWIRDLDRIRALEPFAEDAAFRRAFAGVKLGNKHRLARKIRERLGIEVDPESLFDVQVKRIHEYKRQLLNVLRIIDTYERIRTGALPDPVPRTLIFAGKAAPGYHRAKLIIKLIHDVADVVNADPAVEGRLRVVFIPNYDVSTAQDIIPAAELSEQISTAGTEASGTGNMKLGLNGALTIGTLDGANVEMAEAVGREHLFIFGHTREDVERLWREGYDPRAVVEGNPRLARVLEMLATGFFSSGDRQRYAPLLSALLDEGDRYLVLADFAAYCDAQEQVDALYRDQDAWQRSAILNVARLGYFSSDRAIREYAERIWKVRPVAHE
ncbi:MAG: glycogen/starch/alpha-glucan phosphorylase [Gammaproteobacteria bacterium]|nr:MAG: glycogen/starch/alpha-glucan phosphorylase [Gammaproteobacteria bacterium]